MMPAPEKNKDALAKYQPLTATRRLLAGLRDGKMADIELVGDDGIHVPALRCVLACSSPVLHRLLYADPSKASASVIKINGCGNKTLRALVEYCCSDELNASIWDGSCPPAEIVKDIVALARVAHSYGIPNMEERVLEGINPLMSAIPPLACTVFNYADATTTPEIHRSALSSIRERPYVCLKQNGQSVGGMVCLTPDKLKQIIQDSTLQVDEFFLFNALLRWRTHNQDTYSNVNAICKQLVKHINLVYIDPNDLKSTVVDSGLVEDRSLVDALLEQSIAATKEGLAFASLRGKAGKESGHVMVQGAGSFECNGIYKQIHREGTLLCYGKRIDEKRTMWLLKDNHSNWKICDHHNLYYEWRGSQEDQYDQFPVSGWSASNHTAGNMPVPTAKWLRPRGKSPRVLLTATGPSSSSTTPSMQMRPVLQSMSMSTHEPRHSPGEESLPHHRPIHQSYSRYNDSMSSDRLSDDNQHHQHRHHQYSIQRSQSNLSPRTPVAVEVAPQDPSPMLSFAPAALPSLRESVTWQM